jgi:hypothetical protein
LSTVWCVVVTVALGEAAVGIVRVRGAAVVVNVIVRVPDGPAAVVVIVKLGVTLVMKI